MNTFSKSGLRGFSLIEMMIGIAIMGMLLAVAAPQFNAWILNAQIRNAAESIQDGLQRARAEAVARNTNVAFVLKAAAANDQTSWDVVVPIPAPATTIETRLSNEGSKKVIRTVVPVGATTVTFDNTGRPYALNPTDGSARITSIALDLPIAILPAAQSQDLKVTIDFGGSIKMCDPNVSVSNARGCPF